MNVNEAELKIQYIKYRPSLPYDSKSPITFTIPGNTTPHVSLRDSYLFVQCHVEKTDEYGNPSTTDPTHAKRSLNNEGEEEATPPSKSIKKDDEEDPHLGRRENGSHSHRGIAEEEQSGTRQVMASDMEDYLEEAERRWRKAQRAWTAFHTEMDMSEKAKKRITTKGLEDLSVQGLQQYLEAKYQVLQDQGEDGAIIPVDNVLHSMWSGVDITMKGELVSTTSQKYMYKSYIGTILNNSHSTKEYQLSTTSQKYMYKSYIETILNNSHSTKEYQLKLSGYYGDDGDKDEDYLMNWNKGMEQRHLHFHDGQKVEMIGFILSDIFGIQASIVNGVEIGITLIPNTDIMCLQSFHNRKFGCMVINDIYLYVCKRQFTNKVVVAYAGIMEETEATYLFKCTEVRAYNGNKGNTEVTIENPYKSKILTRFILGMVSCQQLHW